MIFLDFRGSLVDFEEEVCLNLGPFLFLHFLDHLWEGRAAVGRVPGHEESEGTGQEKKRLNLITPGSPYGGAANS